MRTPLFGSTRRGWWHSIVIAVAVAVPLVAQETALDRYVAEADSSFSWELRSTHAGLGFRTFNLRMTSQTWLTPAEVSGNRWQHWLRVIVPANVQSSKAVLLINGGSTNEADPGPAAVEFGAATALTGIVLAELRAVPNQPLAFVGESSPRSEDAILAYTWDKFLRTGDQRWPAHLPMTKAAVRAMDAVTQFCATPDAGRHAIDGFIVAGGSKRGWIAWLTAAVDRRVVGLVPLVFDALNPESSFRNHWQTYGFWSSAVSDYEKLGIFGWLGTTPSRALMRIVDPFEYRSRLAMPKYIINASGDEFFPPTSSQLYFRDLPGTNSLRYIPNASHSLEGAEIETLGSAIAWAQSVIRGSSIPQYSWQVPEEGRIVVNASSQPTLVRLWQASNPTARDFRFQTIGAAWTSVPLARSGEGVYQAAVERPAHGWRAFFVELQFPSGILFPLVFTTPVQVIPGILPFRPPVASVLAASFHPLTAPGAIASGFGEAFAPGITAAASLPLPTELGGTSVRVLDSRGIARLAGLFFVSPGQLNYLIPAESATGVARLEVLRSGQKTSEGQLLIEGRAPGLFSANGNGMGVAAGIAVVVLSDGTQATQLLFEAAEAEGSRGAVPIRVGPDAGQVFLSLFGTGMRNASTATARVGGEPVGISGPVPSAEFAGVDQVNLGPLPGSLSGRGEVEVNVMVDGLAANVVTVRFQ